VSVAAAACGGDDTNATGDAGLDATSDGSATNDSGKADSATPADSGMGAGDAANADSATPPGDSGAGAGDGGPGPGLLPDPGAITCGATTCPDASGTPPMNEVRAYCCVLGPNTGNPVSQTCEYQNLGACESGKPYYCDEAADCNAGLVCCMSNDLRAWTACESTCTGVTLCKSSAECTNGQPCTPVTCDGQHIGTCGPLPASLAQVFGCQ
jgi:hypothetical protein